MQMTRNYQSDLLTITQDAATNIFYFNILKDEYNTSQINIIKEYFTNLFEYFATNPVLYGCVFNIKALSSYCMFKYVKDLKLFFQDNERLLHKYIGATAIIIDSTFIRIVLTPLIQLVNKGRPLKFTRDDTSAADFIVTELTKDTVKNKLLITEPPPNESRHHSYETGDIDIEELD
jgi:hypothetical protein